MKLIKHYWIWIIPTAILWGLFYLFFNNRAIGDLALFQSFLFSFSIIVSLLFIQNKIIPKLSTFSVTGQIFLKTVLYIVAILAVSSLIFVIFAFYSLSEDLVISEMIVGFAKATLLIFLPPISDVSIGDIIPQKAEYMFYIVVISFSFIGLGSALVSFIQTRWSHERSMAQINEAQIKMLQAQIQPHFLFNTLNTIVSLVKQNPVKAEEMLLQFSDFYRFSFSSTNRKTIPLKEEILFIENYLNLLKARFGDYLTWSFKIDTLCKTLEIPVMILQPIVENAIKHGWQEKKHNFEISVMCSKKTNSYQIIIKDDGSGFHIDKEKMFPPKGHGLYAIQERLKLFYKRSNLIAFKSDVGQGTTITINLPV
jgi:hypothetical protein